MKHSLVKIAKQTVIGKLLSFADYLVRFEAVVVMYVHLGKLIGPTFVLKPLEDTIPVISEYVYVCLEITHLSVRPFLIASNSADLTSVCAAFHALRAAIGYMRLRKSQD